MYETAEIGTLYQTSAVIFLLSNQTFTTSWSKSVTVYTLWTEGALLFLDQTEARRAEKNFLRLGAPLISGSGWAVPPLPEGLHPPFEAYPCILCHNVSQRDTPLRIASLSYITLASIPFVPDRVYFMDRLVIEVSRINIPSLTMFTLNSKVYDVKKAIYPV